MQGHDPLDPAGNRVATAVALWLLKAYKLVLSPLFAGSCRYLPSCSDYAAGAIHDHGVLRGTWLATRRLARCHPFGGSGLDPVPPRRPAETATRPHVSQVR
jgi:putative membrane protein insertion efficiency factor